MPPDGDDQTEDATGTADASAEPPPSRVKRASATATAAAEAAQRRAESLRGKSTTFDACMRASALDKRRAGGLLAGGIAFRLFVWILPAALLVTGVFGLVHTISPKDPATVARNSGLGGVVANAVGSASQQSSRATVALIAIGLVLTVYTGMSCVRAFRLAFLLAWGLPLTRRKGLVTDGIWFSIGVITLLSLGGVSAWLRDNGPLGGIFAGLVVPIVGAIVWLVFSERLPHADGIPWTALIPGALVLYGGLQLMHLATEYYFAAKLSSGGQLYGSLGVAATLLLWLFVVARLVTIGAFLNASLWYRSHPETVVREDPIF